MKSYKDQSGIGLIEVMLLVGLIGSFGYFLMAKQKEASDIKIRSEYNFEIDNAEALLRDTLADVFNCTWTVGATAIGTPSSGGDLLRIGTGRRNTSGPIPFAVAGGKIVASTAVGNEIRPGIRVAAINLISDGGRDFIRVRFVPTERKKGKIKSSGEIIKNFYIEGIKSGGVYSRCSLEVPEAIKSENCTKIGGGWNATTKKCELTGYYLRSVDTINLYRNSVGTISTTPPVFANATCSCPPHHCNLPDFCCLPACPAGSYIASDPLKELPYPGNGNQCNITASCVAQPFASAIKPP